MGSDPSHNYIIEAKLPVLEMIQESGRPAEELGSHLWEQKGKDLEKTEPQLGKRYYIWLLLNRCRSWPTKVSDVVGLLGGPDCRWMRTDGAAEFDGGASALRDGWPCGRPDQAVERQNFAGCGEEHADGNYRETRHPRRPCTDPT